MNNKTSSILVVVVNGTPMLEYDREKKLTDTQKQSLALMEKKLNKAVELDGQIIQNPNLQQKIEFVTANLITAILNDEEILAAASCAYIANALPELKQIKSFEKEGEISIELVFDREYQREKKMSFTPMSELSSKPH